MKRPVPLAPVPRVALKFDEAAAALGISRYAFERYVRWQLPILRLGKMRLVAVSALEQWVSDQLADTPHPRARGRGGAHGEPSDLDLPRGWT